MFMKKIVSIILCITLCAFVFGACKSSNIEENNPKNDTDIQIQKNQSDSSDVVEQSTTAPAKQIKIGDKITFDNMEICINSVDIKHKVVPDNTNGVYSYYEADKGNVYIVVDADVKNNAKESLDCDDIGSAKAVYDDGYVYDSCFIVGEDDDDSFSTLSEVNPLETKGVKWLITCTEEIEKTNSKLFVELSLNGERFILNLR